MQNILRALKKQQRDEASHAEKHARKHTEL